MELLIQANATNLPLPDNCVQTCVTSPPYWGLRRYSGEQEFVWGGDPQCEHEFGDRHEFSKVSGDHKSGKTRTTDRSYGDDPTRRYNGTHQKHSSGSFCHRCNAWRGGLGLEPTPELYVEHLTTVFREVRRVLRRDGTLWLNIGDSYFGEGGFTPGSPSNEMSKSGKYGEALIRKPSRKHESIKSKDLVGIPWMVAFALRDDGWYLRSDIIWRKPNVMPASVTDRPTTAHEHVFLFSKSSRYFYDRVGIQEPAVTRTLRESNFRRIDGYAAPGQRQQHRDDRPPTLPTATRNARSVWTIPTQPFAGKHFAVMPAELVRRCLRAATSRQGSCGRCGAPWKRIVRQTTESSSGSGVAGNKPLGKEAITRIGGNKNLWTGPLVTWNSIGWEPTCECRERAWIGGSNLVLDPFGGSGTVAAVCKQMMLDCIHVDLAYHDLARIRLQKIVAPLAVCA